MFEKVNPSHPDKVADRIAGALVDLAYKKAERPRIAVEVLIGHGTCTITAESSVELDDADVIDAVMRIAGGLEVTYIHVPQDVHLGENQEGRIRCGDNGIFKGEPRTAEEVGLSTLCREFYKRFPTDGKMILDGQNERLIICQSHATNEEIQEFLGKATQAEINPLGEWTGGPDVDTGATNRKLGSDMGRSVTGGGLHGKDLSKADVSVNIYCWLEAQRTGKVVEMCCAIGDENVGGVPYEEIVNTARVYIEQVGGFEKFAEWGLL